MGKVNAFPESNVDILATHKREFIEPWYEVFCN